MKIRFDFPSAEGWQTSVELPAVPRRGDFVNFGDAEYVVRDVIWHTGPEPWAQVILKP